MGVKEFLEKHKTTQIPPVAADPTAESLALAAEATTPIERQRG